MKTLLIVLASIFVFSACEKQDDQPEVKKISSETATYKVTIYNNTMKYRAQSQTLSVNYITGGIVLDSINGISYFHHFGDSLCFEKNTSGYYLYYNLHYQHSIVFFTNEKRFRIEVWLPGNPGPHKRSDYISSDIKEFTITDDTVFN